MKLQGTFVRGRMNKDIDERLLEKGEYPHAENARIIDSGDSHVGAVENELGTDQLTNFSLNNAVTIGRYADSANQKIYFMVTSDTKDLVVEYDDFNNITSVLLESSRPNGVLNFSRNYLITGIDKIVNGDSTKDLLSWTDDLNPPRRINIERAKTYAPDGFIEEDISVIKRPPKDAPGIQLTFTPSTLENNLREKFLCFAYRWKYLDGEFSPLSPIAYPAFSPNKFDLNFQTLQNDGMYNSANAADISFNTGSERVTDIQLVFKETNSDSVYLIETFNKADQGWGHDETQNFVFANNKVYTVLPQSELYRTFDNVPRLAKAQAMVGNRQTYFNFLEQYDMVDIFGDKVDVDFNVSLQTTSLTGQSVPVGVVDLDYNGDGFVVDLNGVAFNAGTRLVFTFDLLENTYDSGSFNSTFEFVLNTDYATVEDLVNSEEFQLLVSDVMTSVFTQNYEAVPPANSTVVVIHPFEAVPFGAGIRFKAPQIVYQIDNTPGDPGDDDFTIETSYWKFTNLSLALYKLTATDSSLKTNRDYEVGLLYEDDDVRKSTVFTAPNNTLYIPQKYSTFKNRIRVNVNNKAPEWAKTYRIVVKQNKLDYQTIYVNVYYTQGLFKWVKLEGENVDKVTKNAVLYVKSDLSGAIPELTRVKVIDVVSQPAGFLGGDEEAGLYMKIKPRGFNMSQEAAAILDYSRYFAERDGRPNVFLGRDQNGFVQSFDPDTGMYTDLAITGGTSIHIRFHNYESDGYSKIYEQDFIVQDNYPNFETWFNTEVQNLGDQAPYFETEFQRNFTTNYLEWRIQGAESGTRTESSKLQADVNIVLSPGVLIFETEGTDVNLNIYYESSETFRIDGINHLGNIQDQNAATGDPAVVEIDMFNCFAMGNGAESYKIFDGFNTKSLNIDFKPTSTSIAPYAAIRRYADLTWSEVYNESSAINGLNEFNLYKINYKEDIQKQYGYGQLLYARDTNLMLFQEDKVSYVMFGKTILMNADGTFNVTAIDEVFGEQVMYTGEYGISRNPESFAVDANNVYWIDSKRGVPLRLGGNGIIEINYGLDNWYRERFRDALYTRKLGAYNPQDDQYVVSEGGASVNPVIRIKCSDSIIRRHFQGVQEILVDYGTLVGQAGFSFNTNGVPIRFQAIWGDTVIFAPDGFLGDPSYNAELEALGYPPVIADGNFGAVFDKDSPYPNIVRFIFEAPIEGLEYDFSPTCVISPPLTVIGVVSNDNTFEGFTIDNRYRWVSGTYSSAFKHYYTLFGSGAVSLYQTMTGAQGSGFIPSSGSTLIMEAYNGFTETTAFPLGGQFRYLLSNTLYTEADISALLTASTQIPATQVPVGGGDTLYRGSVVLPTITEQYLYLVWDYTKLKINPETRILIYFDASGSMNSTLDPLRIMRDTLLKDALLPFYNNDPDLYDDRVQIIEWTDERTMEVLDMQGMTPPGNVVTMVFQDEAQAIYHSSTSITPRTPQYDADIAVLRARLESFSPVYYRGVVFQVQGSEVFKQLMQAVEDGVGDYSGVHGLADRDEIIFRYDIEDGDTPEYYLDKVITALEDLGFTIT